MYKCDAIGEGMRHVLDTGLFQLILPPLLSARSALAERLMAFVLLRADFVSTREGSRS